MCYSLQSNTWTCLCLPLCLIWSTYLWVALAHAPDGAYARCQHPHGTEGGEHVRLLHAHHKQPHGHQQQPQHDEPIAVRLVLSHWPAQGKGSSSHTSTAKSNRGSLTAWSAQGKDWERLRQRVVFGLPWQMPYCDIVLVGWRGECGLAGCAVTCPGMVGSSQRPNEAPRSSRAIPGVMRLSRWPCPRLLGRQHVLIWFPHVKNG